MTWWTLALAFPTDIPGFSGPVPLIFAGVEKSKQYLDTINECVDAVRSVVPSIAVVVVPAVNFVEIKLEVDGIGVRGHLKGSPRVPTNGANEATQKHAEALSVRKFSVGPAVHGHVFEILGGNSLLALAHSCCACARRSVFGWTELEVGYGTTPSEGNFHLDHIVLVQKDILHRVVAKLGNSVSKNGAI